MLSIILYDQSVVLSVIIFYVYCTTGKHSALEVVFIYCCMVRQPYFFSIYYCTIQLYYYITIYLYHYISICLYVYIIIYFNSTIDPLKWLKTQNRIPNTANHNLNIIPHNQLLNRHNVGLQPWAWACPPRGKKNGADRCWPRLTWSSLPKGSLPIALGPRKAVQTAAWLFPRPRPRLTFIIRVIPF